MIRPSVVDRAAVKDFDFVDLELFAVFFNEGDTLGPLVGDVLAIAGVALAEAANGEPAVDVAGVQGVVLSEPLASMEMAIHHRPPIRLDGPFRMMLPTTHGIAVQKVQLLPDSQDTALRLESPAVLRQFQQAVEAERAFEAGELVEELLDPVAMVAFEVEQAGIQAFQRHQDFEAISLGILRQSAALSEAWLPAAVVRDGPGIEPVPAVDDMCRLEVVDDLQHHGMRLDVVDRAELALLTLEAVVAVCEVCDPVQIGGVVQSMLAA